MSRTFQSSTRMTSADYWRPIPTLTRLGRRFTHGRAPQSSPGKGVNLSSHATRGRPSPPVGSTAYRPCRIGLRHLTQTRPESLPTIRFLCIGTRFCLLLPSDPSSRKAPWIRLTVPATRSVRDFHPLDSPHAGRTREGKDREGPCGPACQHANQIRSQSRQDDRHGSSGGDDGCFHPLGKAVGGPLVSPRSQMIRDFPIG